eukprot:symbB.v1.2.017406.t1/scaffold1329.1/size125172/2
MKTSRHQVCGRCEKPIPPEGRFCGGCFPDVIREALQLRETVGKKLAEAAALRHKLDSQKREEAELEARKCDLEARLFASETGIQDSNTETAQLVLANLAQLRTLQREDEVVRLAAVQPPIQMDGKLCVEVLQARGLSSSEYRLFDLTSSLLGCRRIRPYVTCKVHWGTQETDMQCSPHVEAGNGNYAFWGHKLLFPLNKEFWKMQSFKVKVESFDKRELQGTLRGDSLIGRAELQVDSAQLEATPQREVPLHNAQGQLAGQLLLRFQLQAPEEALNIMAHSSQATLAAAAMAFAQTLRPGKVLRFVHQTLGQGQT